jgi:hypothetical protein
MVKSIHAERTVAMAVEATLPASRVIAAEGLRTITIQDRVLAQLGSRYAARREPGCSWSR